ncbi:histone deacetylase HosB [Aspergillus flavus]|uniref:Histone deacetylase HosB n=1 Tax=Aspergillus flavus (strain ATCC 200026 / FGSC A1120 / IAM 13836 / NRRL 3357 / JCM 12722 / SRRC 167) TaxID=332952 RepID=A0A7G5KIM8_ASPFN|nr:uncharacterized protein G4B84_011149 [Aspergillus flavus NRRL3357]KAF7627021.1 hypothetical protein AFLA_012961 [Aspergillus flavus NRRL3357]QMW35658.1 hypothetical protein G4B84_011149 [Aspergillus flavus NRRL3357]QMW47720.1 hypothetical protein G4B11_011199 [Aspergillus flavus]QRD92095.1 histone deacetylase HosB [Aspergillus flavus]
MDPSKRDDDPPAASFTPTSTSDALASPTTTNDPVDRSHRLNNVSMLATPLPVSPSGFSSSSLLSPADAPARSTSPQAHTAPRRISSSNSLRDEHRSSSLKKRSSTASLRSVRNDSRTSTSPHRSVSQHSSSSLSSSPTATTPTTLSNPNMLSKKSRLTKANELPTPTAASIATDHFQREVELHHSADLQSQTLVVIHDACYGHRFSRPRASRAALGSIVERPERIQASVLGVSAAYVRLTHRYEGGRFAPHPDMNLDELPVPPFQICRTARSMALSSPAVTHVHGSRWMDDLKTMCDAAESRLALNGKELVRPPSAGKDGATETAPSLHEGDLYLCSESLNAFEGALGGVCEGVDAVFGPRSTKRAFVCIRPPGHHCSSDHPSGFCWINNVHVGISYAAMTHGLTHAAILDFDLHHGDGSQEIAWEQNRKATAAPRSAANYKKTAIGYFSLHDINSYPCEMGEPEKVRNASVCIDKAHGQSVWNVHLEQWKTEAEFWDLYASKYAVLIEKARAFLRFHTERLASTPNGPPPVAAIFISAGFDASEWEGAGMQRHKVNVPTEFYAKFTADVVRMAEEEGLGVGGRIVSVLEGGYSNRALTTGVLSHLSGLGDATSCLVSGGVDDTADRLTAEMTNRLGLLDISANVQHASSLPAYDSGWWSPALLEELEALVYPPPAVKPREKSTPTYFAPTQSFTAKVVTTPRDRRSTGSQISVETDAPPLPPVSWATATHELSRILIPSHRQTTSCRPEDLNAEATRLRRERQTAAQHTSVRSAGNEESRMKLRARKPKTPLPETPNKETSKRQAIKSNRRTTIERASDLPDPSFDKSPNTRSTTRRKSAASTITSTPENKAPGDKTVRSASAASTRRPGSSRSATPKRASSPKTAPPVPRVPSVYTNLSAGEEAVITPVESRSLSRGTPDTPQDDLDSLTAGVRKLNIKLKVPSPEEHAARERERERQTSKRVSKTPIPSKKSSGTKGLNAPANKMAAHSNTALVRPDAENPITSLPTATGVVAEGSDIHGGAILDRSTVMSTAVPSQALPLQTSISPPVTPGATYDSTHPQHALYSPPISEPSVKAGIPVFISNSPIPFAPASAHHATAPSTSRESPP